MNIKSYFFLLLAVSCSPEPLPKQNEEMRECGMVTAIGEDNRGDYIIISYNGEKSRYKVYNYMDYELTQTVCSFDNLVKQPM